MLRTIWEQNRYTLYVIGAFLALGFLIFSKSEPESLIPPGINQVHQMHITDTNYSVLLTDMDMVGDKYFHQYDVIVEKNDTIFESSTTNWIEVSPIYFKKYQNSLGMEVGRKIDGKTSNNVTPPGYSNYVGNEQYGHWEKDSSGDSFWVFYAKYRILSDLFGYGMGYYRPTYRSWYDGRSYYRSNRDYYGGGGFGSSSYTKTARGKKSKWASQPSSFKEKVRSKVSRSSSRYTRSRTRSRSSSGFGK